MANSPLHGSGKIKWLIGVICLSALLIAPFFLYPIFLAKLLCLALFACAFNLLLGYVGLLSFGHAAFFGIASYSAAHALKEWGLSAEVGLAVGMLVAAILGLAIGLLAIRRQGIYFSMITLALAQLVYFFCLQAPFTHGEDGIQNVPRGLWFGLFALDNVLTLYYVVAGMTCLGLLVIWRVVNSPFGNILKAIRENEQRAISLGYRVQRYKLGAFVISAALAGLAGGLKALVFQLATLNDVSWSLSGEIVLMTLLGGIGTLSGPVVGASLIVSLENYLAGSELPFQVVLGLIFVLCVLVFSRGIVGEVSALIQRKRH
ncbi:MULTISPECIES: branched-chain amino acid ABC transporter permease [Polaromonas]|uniref:Branched-chain amino acid ABC transporter permease n=1 Tax=Polaromonas aquatica TaxID=332657 RepID=A0ABW1U874_9BURK